MVGRETTKILIEKGSSQKMKMCKFNDVGDFGNCQKINSFQRSSSQNFSFESKGLKEN